MNNTSKSSLVNVEDSVLVVVDFQDYFLSKYSDSTSQSVLKRGVWLIELAKQLHIPIVAMAEDIEKTGGLSQAILDVLPNDINVHNKNIFGLGGHPEILQAVSLTGRKTAVLIGMETDVCVAHSALHLLKEGYHVVVIKDAVATTGTFDQDMGLERMRDAGAVVTSTKGIYYEWIRSVDNLKSLIERMPELYKKAPMKL